MSAGSNLQGSVPNGQSSNGGPVPSGSSLQTPTQCMHASMPYPQELLVLTIISVHPSVPSVQLGDILSSHDGITPASADSESRAIFAKRNHYDQEEQTVKRQRAMKSLRDLAVVDLEHPTPLAHPSYWHGSIPEISWGSTKLVWLCGSAGAGKTTLAQTMIRDWLKRSPPNDSPCRHTLGDPLSAMCLKTIIGTKENATEKCFCATIYFQKRSPKEDPLLVTCSAIAHQWAHEVLYLDSVLHKTRHNLDTVKRKLEIEFPLYIGAPFGDSTLWPNDSVYLVFIDGLERCHVTETRQQIVRYIGEHIRDHPTSPIRWLITSHSIEWPDDLPPLQNSGDNLNSSDVHGFITSNFRALYGDGCKDQLKLVVANFGDDFTCASAIIAFLRGCDFRDGTNVANSSEAESNSRQADQLLTDESAIQDAQATLQRSGATEEETEATGRAAEVEVTGCAAEAEETGHAASKSKGKLDGDVQGSTKETSDRQGVEGDGCRTVGAGAKAAVVVSALGEPEARIYGFYDYIVKPEFRSLLPDERKKAKCILGFYLLPFGFGSWARSTTPLFFLAEILEMNMDMVNHYLGPFRDLLDIPTGRQAMMRPLRFLHPSFIEYLCRVNIQATFRIDARGVELHLWAYHVQRLMKFNSFKSDPPTDESNEQEELQVETEKFVKDCMSQFEAHFVETARHVLFSIERNPVVWKAAFPRLDSLEREQKVTLADAFKEIDFGNIPGESTHRHTSASLACFLNEVWDKNSPLHQILEEFGLLFQQNLSMDELRAASKGKKSLSVDKSSRHESSRHEITLYTAPEDQILWRYTHLVFHTVANWFRSIPIKPFGAIKKPNDCCPVILGLDTKQGAMWYDSDTMVYYLAPYAPIVPR
ncbi:hypothetical protein AN958_01030 [Leucoagaricus sp. SymC.cos]|nr:hypothetical protein AN958_01030 [Leucoagaricus sp. SymC.cos]